jgi:hypothetical protein
MGAVAREAGRLLLFIREADVGLHRREISLFLMLAGNFFLNAFVPIHRAAVSPW